MFSRLKVIGATAAAVVLSVPGCGWLDEEAGEPTLPWSSEVTGGVEEQPAIDEPEDVEDTGPVDETAPPDMGFDDEPCSEDELRLDESDESDFVSAHRVIGGELGPVCFGEADWTLLEAWEVLAAIATPEQRSLVTRFVGYASPEDDEDETTVAYVFTADEEGWEFQMAINLDVGRQDANELALTVVHEFAHVLTRTQNEKDRFSDLVQCTTYATSEGCFEEDSYIAMWVEEFWGQWLDDLDPAQDAGVALGEPRCAADPGFLNDYSASSPEEDFAEAFSAFVMGVEVPPSVQPRLDFLARFPEFVAIRDRALAAGLGPLPNTFTGCG